MCLIYNLEQFKVAFFRVWEHKTLKRYLTKQTLSSTKYRNHAIVYPIWEIHSVMVVPSGSSERMEGSERIFLTLSTAALPALQLYLLILSMDCTLGNIDQVFHSYLTLKHFSSSENRGSIVKYLDFGLR